MTTNPNEPKSLPDLVIHALRETSELVQTETRLIRAELSDKVTQVQAAGGALAAGGICLLVALITLTGALVAAIAEIGEPNIGAGWAALIVGVALAILGAVLLMKGKKELEPGKLMPNRTADQLNKDVRLAKEQTR
ncbi:phage holin family protein [Fulvimarina sp. 2208YS6-2-32]|uniref:Phage holin family protein n=1 Tax=Fulvimarina uroteuthidis TaxID=3098149 RepID=A0ABU5I1D8_9HYPH|nr:phage holin family protein [Fulvimarina sp. 2208YS6-2-32]MDY8108783.1 phage holin family protein [Fulvimarina sp. 2208YS6-2-32]